LTGGTPEDGGFLAGYMLKKNMERTCKSMGLTMTSAFTMFATKMTKEQRIPFEIEADPFFSEENIQEIERRVANLNAGKSTLKEHELIEVE
jgi:DNA-damage-inducible protein J